MHWYCISIILLCIGIVLVLYWYVLVLLSEQDVYG